MVKKINEVKDYASKYKYVYDVLLKNDYVRSFENIYTHIGIMAGNDPVKFMSLAPSIFNKVSYYLKDIYDIDVISYNNMVNEIRIGTNKKYSEDDIIDAIRNSIDEKIMSVIIYDTAQIEQEINKFRSFVNSKAIEIYKE